MAHNLISAYDWAAGLEADSCILVYVFSALSFSHYPWTRKSNNIILVTSALTCRKPRARVHGLKGERKENNGETISNVDCVS